MAVHLLPSGSALGTVQAYSSARPDMANPPPTAVAARAALCRLSVAGVISCRIVIWDGPSDDTD